MNFKPFNPSQTISRAVINFKKYNFRRYEIKNKRDKSKLSAFFIKLIATGLGTGYCPIIPGTIGSLIGILLFFLLIKLGFWINIIILTILFFIGVFSAGYAEKLFGKKDSHQIVIDEAICCMLFLLFIPCVKWYIITGFIVYRLLDIIKPFPANISQRLPGGWGIMVDDLIVAIYTILIVNIVSHLK